jgi:uncharacterized membrane protein
MNFAQPWLLLLLVPLLAFAVWLGRPSRGPSRRREIAVLVVRCLLIAALVGALAGAQLVRSSSDLAVVYLLDFSDSVGPAGRALTLDYVQRSLEHMGPDDRAGIVVFGEDAVVDRPVTAARTLGEITSVVNRRATDLASAVRLGMALFPGATARRLVLISDGLATTGPVEVERAVRLAGAAGVRLDVVPLAIANGPEALVAAVDAPPRLHQGEEFGLAVTLAANTTMRARLRAFASGALVSEQDVQLNEGGNTFVLTLHAGQPGFTAFRVQIEPEQDTYFQNNTLSAFSLVSGPPRVLLVADDEREAQALNLALAGAGLDVTLVQPPGLPSELAGLSAYASVVLVDTPASSFSLRQLAVLQSYVRDLGGGLVAIGGPHAYGVGGWFQTALEETLPVDMQVKDPKRFPALAIVVIMDESGSMAIEENGHPKYQLASEAAARVADMLHEFDELTVVGFDTQPTTVVGPFSVKDREAAIPKILAIGPGGGGIFIYEGLQYGYAQLLKSDKPTKHIILLADGDDSENQQGAAAMVEQYRKDNNITLTVVAIGNGKDVPFLKSIAELGGGRFHLTDKAATLPTIFAQEAAEVQRSYIVEEPFNVTQHASSPILQGIDSAPQLLGYVATTAKPAAQVVLASPENDPVLAQWQYGLGRAVAFTSDATGRWATQWLTWDRFARFWAQTVRWTIREDAQENLEPQVTYAGGQALVTVDALDNLGATMNGMSLTLRLVTPSLAPQDVRMEQIAPGRYAGTFMPGEEGAYLMGFSGVLPDGRSVIQTSGWVNPYSPEYRVLQSGDTGAVELRALASLTGGGVLTTPEAAFAHNLPAERASQDIWSWLLLFATLLLPVDVAIRRLVISRYEVRKALAAMRDALRLPGTAPRPAPVRAEGLSRLFEAKTRTGKVRSALLEPAAERTEHGHLANTGRDTAPPTPAPATPVTKTPPDTTATGEDGTLARKLLKKKRQS